MQSTGLEPLLKKPDKIITVRACEPLLWWYKQNTFMLFNSSDEYVLSVVFGLYLEGLGQGIPRP
jgi:hypothetical protein